MTTYYLSVSIRPFPNIRDDKGYYAYVDRLRKGSGNVLERRVIEGCTKQQMWTKLKRFVSNYKKEYSYLEV